MSYEHIFMKKCSGHKHCAKSRVESSFVRFFVHHLENSKYWTFPMYPWEVVRALFTKKLHGHKLCAKSRADSSFDQFFVHHLGNSNYWPFLMY
ncbi:hypothetical protein BHM03_00035317 [Ensete ventricosum]|nr:hypothetical protein BHM03_00035317 [Ensete ventricosum]